MRIKKKIITMDYGFGGQGSIIGRENSFLFLTESRQDLGPTQAPIQRVPAGLSSGTKRPVRESDRSPTSSAEVKNGGVIPQLSNKNSQHIAE
jgi:hypothetical protein